MNILFLLSVAVFIPDVDSSKRTIWNVPDDDSVVDSVRNWLASRAADKGSFADQAFAGMELTSKQAQEIGRLIWDERCRTLKKQRAGEWHEKVIQLSGLRMKFEYRIFGEQPVGGRSLYISMHGGGETSARVNDQQWKNQIGLYQPEEGIYLAPRAPNDAWNMWHQSHIDQFFRRIIQDAVLFEGVNPNRVYLMGYSAGGDGVYQLAPRMADSLAAAAMMAGHPNNASPLGLRNIGFAIHVGGNDEAFNRSGIALEWKMKLNELQLADPDGYRHDVMVHDGLGHWMQRQDAVAIAWMAEFTRCPRPRKVVWHQSDVLHERFYWLAVEPDQAKAGSTIKARMEAQKIIIEFVEEVDHISILLNDQMVHLDQPIEVEFRGKIIFRGKAKRTAGVINESIQHRFDPDLIYSARIDLTIPE